MQGMMALIEARTGGIRCAIAWTGRVRLHVEVKTHCGLQLEADEGVEQLPAVLMNCPACTRTLDELIERNKPAAIAKPIDKEG